MRANFLMGALSLAACAGEPDTSFDGGARVEADSGTSDSGMADSGSADGGGEVDAGVPFEPPTCASAGCEIAWTTGPELPAPVDHHVTFLLGDYLYVLGGLRTENARIQEQYRTVYEARVLPGGGLGPWETFGDLTGTISFHALAVGPDRVYSIGGIGLDDAGELFALSNVLILDPALGGLELRAGQGTGAAFRHATAEIVGEQLVVIGGMGTGQAQDRVFVSPIAEDGMNGAWTDAAPLPEPRTHHSSAVHDGRIYVVGGHGAGMVARDDVLRSVHDDTGALTGWEVVGQVEQSWTQASFVRGDHLYLVGGGLGGAGEEENTGRVRRAEIGEDGLGPWEDVADPLPEGRSHVHQAPTRDSWIYYVGGRAGTSFSSTAATSIGRFQE